MNKHELLQENEALRNLLMEIRDLIDEHLLSLDSDDDDEEDGEESEDLTYQESG